MKLSCFIPNGVVIAAYSEKEMEPIQNWSNPPEKFLGVRQLM